MTTETITKVALTRNEDKRFLLEDGTHETLSWGYTDIPALEELYVLDNYLEDNV